ncbi:MAG TPA: hypothetical protein VMT79_00455 [Candidatus Binatia bacterium]|nr:hypothetical protein [Candidatus Binatia bacterium]
MALTTALSVASFSVVLAEAFGAVMLSTLIPATFVETANTLKRIAKQRADSGQPVSDSDAEGALTPLASLPGVDAIRDAIRNVAAATAEPSDLHLLLPKHATIDAEFEFHGQEEYAANVGVGAQIQLVTVNAGYSSLYSVSSSNKVKLHVQFETVKVTIAP